MTKIQSDGRIRKWIKIKEIDQAPDKLFHKGKHPILLAKNTKNTPIFLTIRKGENASICNELSF